ncbi:hypothetical protein BY996DRAFT_4580269 [Phakopsora pachyrhizi]|uniref:DUF7872 domain-containing protein n=1 Tax=Phakopsora pachyrhizi TaxID=170000 RepID=A0AAV0BGQ4_PHAPC|nr:hypothetical protein BY996DRAFT_4580269 [Phakopsora pachyrhizi]CAH7685657.1 hypothetical protein PPACK8108_LOCUS20228 [Phakopsora pachyrhizi]
MVFFLGSQRLLLQAVYSVALCSTQTRSDLLPHQKNVNSSENATVTKELISSNSTTINDPCARLPLTPDLWKSLNLNNYLINYPDGNKLTLESYAEKVNATNFDCGIGKQCNANQICLPVRGPDWYILVAAQNWNVFNNEMYQATAFAMDIVLGLSSSIVNEVAYHELDNLAIESTLIGLFAGLCGAIPGFLYPPALGIFGPKVWPFIQGGTGLIAGLAWSYHNIFATGPADEFSKTTDVQYILSKAQSQAQNKIADDARKVLQNGISAEDGLYGVLKDGIFLNNHRSVSEFSEREIQDAISMVARARLLAAIWKATKCFIIRGNASCTQDGPDGTFPGNDVLSYCDENGIMMSIVQSKNGKLISHFSYAPLINQKYNFTTKYFTQHSWDCQQKYNKYGYDPYLRRALPANPQAECIVSLPVCDLTREDIHRKKKKKGILKACREVGKIPGI